MDARHDMTVRKAISFVLRKCQDLAPLRTLAETHGATAEDIKAVVGALSCRYARKKRRLHGKSRHIPTAVLQLCPAAWLGWIACNVDHPTDVDMDRFADCLPARLTAKEMDVCGNHNLVMHWLMRHGRATYEDIAHQARRREQLRNTYWDAWSAAHHANRTCIT